MGGERDGTGDGGSVRGDRDGEGRRERGMGQWTGGSGRGDRDGGSVRWDRDGEGRRERGMGDGQEGV